MGGRQAYCRGVEAKLRGWDDLLVELRAEAAGETTNVRTRYARCAESFRPRYEEAVRKLDELRAAPATEWRRSKPDMDEAMDDLRGLVARAKIA
jgi:hypothetical protein